MRDPRARSAAAIPAALLLASLLLLPACRRDLIVEPTASGPPRKAVLVLIGLIGDSGAWDSIPDFFRGREYTLLMPNYVSRGGIPASAENLREFLESAQIGRFDEVHVFAFIFGSWTLNTLLQTYEIPNLRSVVYDRSPLQERAAHLVVKAIPGLAWVGNGDAVQSMRDTPYPRLNHAGVPVGLLIETRPTPMVRTFKKETFALGPIDWNPRSLGQPHDDHLYVPFHHNDMYQRLGAYGEEVLHFFEHGRFSPGGDRTPPRPTEVWAESGR